MRISLTNSATTSLARAFIVATAASVLSLSLVGCSVLNSLQGSSPDGSTSSSDETTMTPEDEANTKALEVYAAAERAQLPSILEQTKDIYSDVTVETKAPSTIIFIYVYISPVDPAAGADYFNGKLTDFQDICDNQVFPAMDQAGIKGTKHVHYIYKNPDGSTIWENDFASNS